MRSAIRDFAAAGGEIYAECGGYMYLCAGLEAAAEGHGLDGERRVWPMCGVLEATARMGQGLRSLGYRDVRFTGGAPLGLPLETCRGHEFHWSHIELHRPYAPLYDVTDRAGTRPEGVHHGNVRAGYVHLYWGDLADAAVDAGMDAEMAPAAPAPHSPAGQVILLNGPSSAGKSTLARALQEKLLADHGRHSIILSMDDLLRACPGRPGTLLQGMAATGLPLTAILHAATAEAAHAGAWVIVDHVLGERPDWIADLWRRLRGIPVLPVQVCCELAELERREKGRTDRTPDWPHAARQARDIHAPLPGELRIDTSCTSPEHCAARILSVLALHGKAMPSPTLEEDSHEA